MNCDYCRQQTDYGREPYAANIEQVSIKNRNFRTAIWTGCNLQMTVMCIGQNEDIRLEIHEETDQFIRVEQGIACVKMGNCKNRTDFRQTLYKGDAVFIPAGTWHNIINIGNQSLKVSTIYAPPNHDKGTVHSTKKEAENEEYRRTSKFC